MALATGLAGAAAALALLSLLVAIAFVLWSDEPMPIPVQMPAGESTYHADPADAADPADTSTAMPLAVLGDSNSHSYQDRIAFPPGSTERGGDVFRARTFQWTEVLARLRGDEIDLGPWVAWGRWGPVAAVREVLGLRAGRSPRKEDFLYNFANSGAACRHLTGGRFRQAPRLVELMNDDPARWQRGVVVIRIGLNDWGGLMDLQSREPDASRTRAAISHCTERIGDAMRMIHAEHPQTRIVVVGVANESDDPAYFDQWLSKPETDNIAAALARFNAALRALAESEPNTVFFDDNGWVRTHWGSRGPDGRPDYKTVEIGPALRVTNTAGDAPDNAILGDHHAGLVYNVLWAQSLVARLRDGFGLPLRAIGDDEVARFVQSTIATTPSAAAPPLRAPGS